MKAFSSLFLFAFFISCSVFARDAWHHGQSPYRASFKVISPANYGKCGIRVSVPVCGLGPEDGSDFEAYDQRGQQLAILPLGKSRANEAIAIVRPAQGTKEIHVYFGSKIKSGIHKNALTPTLTCDVRTLPKTKQDPRNWKEVEPLLANSKRLGKVFADQIHEAVNPVDSTDAVFLIFEGYLQIPKSEKRSFMMVTDDAGYLFIDDRLVLERNGRHWARDAARGECRVDDLNLSKGLHKVRCVLVDFGGGLTCVLGRWIDKMNKHVLKPQDFALAGKSKLQTVESRHRDIAIPSFWYKAQSYMGYGGAVYTEMLVGTYSGKEAKWLFRDGFSATGKTVRRILCGLEGMQVRASIKNVTASGLVAIDEVLPKSLSIRKDEDYKTYAGMILSSNVKDLNSSTLKSYINFFNFREMNEDAIPLYEVLSQKKSLSDDDRREAYLGLARATARNFPEKAEKAYAAVEHGYRSESGWFDVARERTEFLIYQKKDFSAAEKMIARMKRSDSKKDSQQAIASLELDLAIVQGKVDEAKEKLNQTLSGAELGARQRFAAVKSNALRQRFYDLMKTGFLGDARKVLYEWMDLSPVDRSHGTLPLARSRYFQRLGWYDGALAELDGAILMDSLLPNLPEVELERGKILQQAGQTEKASQLFLKIVNEYPNHPVAGQAKKLIK